MLSLDQLTPDEASDLGGLLFDLDDTFLERGHVTQDSLEGLRVLARSGMELYALTGRPAAWAHTLAHLLPIQGAIGENGAVAFFRRDGRVAPMDTVPTRVRAERRMRLAELVARLRKDVPRLEPADDAETRTTDFTFDIGEHERAAEADIAAAVSIIEGAGARWTRSSVHLHVSWDRADKATGSVHFLARLGHDSTEILRRFAFIGDSENDAPCFAAFRTTIGVRNLRGRFHIFPRFQTSKVASQGFLEAACSIAAARAAKIS